MTSIPSAPTMVGHRRRLSIASHLPVLRQRQAASLWIGAGILAVIVIGAVFAPWIAGTSPNAIDLEASLAGPGAHHLLGTDQYGRDILARTLYAARVDLLLAVAIVATGLVVGTTIGLLSGWWGGWPDTLLMRIIDVALAFPFLVLVLSVVGMRGPGLLSLYVAVSLVSWVFYARLVREEVRAATHQDYIRAARASGFSSWRVITRHLLPNVVIQPTIYASSDCTYALLLTASVSFLGAGVQPPQAEWGQMVSQGTQFLPAQWWVSTFPAVAIVLTSVGFALIADGLAEISRRGRPA